MRTQRRRGLLHRSPPWPFAIPPPRVRTQACSTNCCVIFPAVAAQQLSWLISGALGQPCYLQVKCVRLSHSAAMLTALKCSLFLERLLSPTALTQLFAEAFTSTFSVFNFGVVPCCPVQVWRTCVEHFPKKKKKCSSTCCRWKDGTAGAHNRV